MTRTARRVAMAVVALLLLMGGQAHAQKTATVQVRVRIIAAAPSFNLVLPTVGQSNGTVYGTTPFTLRTPGRQASAFTTMQTVGAEKALALPGDDVTAPLSIGRQVTTLSQTSATGIVTSAPRFELRSTLPATVVTSFGVGPEANATP